MIFKCHGCGLLSENMVAMQAHCEEEGHLFDPIIPRWIVTMPDNVTPDYILGFAHGWAEARKIAE